MTTLLRPLSLGELLDRTFTLYRHHFVIFVAIVALPNLVGLAMQMANVATGGDQASLGYQLLFMLAALIVSLVTYSMSQAATIQAVSELHLGRTVTIAGAFRAIRDQVLIVCGISLAIGVMIFGGLLLLILPGLYLALRWSLVIPVAVLERAGLWRAIERSGDLTRGDLPRIFVIYFLYFVLVMIFNAMIMIPIGILFFIRGADPTNPDLTLNILAQVASYAVSCIFGPLLTIAMSLVYYDERVRKEAFDLDHLITQAEPSSGATTPA
jgi:hypothetical protein